MHLFIIVHIGRVDLGGFRHLPVLANAIVDASEAIFSTQFENICEFVLDLRPGKSSNDTIVHDEELLLLRVGKSCWPTNVLGWLSLRSLVVCAKDLVAAGRRGKIECMQSDRIEGVL